MTLITLDKMDLYEMAVPMVQASQSGWMSASWLNPTRTSATVFTVDQDVTGVVQKGDRLKFTDTTTKYLAITTVAYNAGTGKTTITTIPTSDYALVGNPSAIYFSHMANPLGYPGVFNYTPTGIAASNVTLAGRYSAVGKIMRGDIAITFTGGITITTMPTLPVAASASFLAGDASQSAAVGTAGYKDSGTGYVPMGLIPCIKAGDTVVWLNTSTGTTMTASVPITWANGDSINVHFEYEY